MTADNSDMLLFVSLAKRARKAILSHRACIMGMATGNHMVELEELLLGSIIASE